MFKSLIKSKLISFYNSKTGPKTTHFWAPALKWSLVIASFSDSKRPVEKLSGHQQMALFSTGAIWTRWAGFVIKPRNFFLASVNFFLTIIAGFQLYRIVDYRMKSGDSPRNALTYIFKG